MKRVLVLMSLLLFSNSSFSQTPTWEKWEQENSIAKHGSFLVIDQPDEPFCYIKQSYYDNTDLMELARVKGKVRLTLPFLSGIDGDLSYWVDSGEKYTVSPDRYSVELLEVAFTAMKAGNILYVKVRPVGESVRIQEFRLNGFTASVIALEDPRCND